MRRPLYIGIGGLCLILFVIIGLEFNLAVSGVPASTSAGAADGATGTAEQTSDDVDTQIATILEHPLFAPDRRGPPAPKPSDQSVGQADRAAPEITGRLGGITIGPGDDKEAVFERGDGEKPLVVKEGDDVDGWTVSSIEIDKVVLTSTFGQKEIQPTFGDPTAAPPLRTRPASQKDGAVADVAATPPVEPAPAARRVPPRPASPGGPHLLSGVPPRQRNPGPNPAKRQ